MPLIVSAAVPVLLSVAFCALLLTPTGRLPRFNDAGVNTGVAEPTGGPLGVVPFNSTVRGSPVLSVSSMEYVDDSGIALLGVNVKVMVQVASGSKNPLQLLL